MYPRVLTRLEKAKWIQRSSDTADRRVLTVRITAAGTTLLARMDKQFKQYEAKVFPDLTEAQLRTFNDLLSAAR